MRFQQNPKFSFGQKSDLRPVWEGKGGGLEPEITEFWPNIDHKSANLVYVVNLVKSTLYYGDPHNKVQTFYKPFFLFLPEMVPIDK